MRWVILSGTIYEKIIERFACRINKTFIRHKIKLEIVRCTGSSIGSLLFQNNIRTTLQHTCSRRYDVCSNDLRNNNMFIESPTNGRSYPIDFNLNCIDSGIYGISCSCLSLYVGKTTTQFSQHFKEHFQKSKTSAVLEHSNHVVWVNWKLIFQYNTWKAFIQEEIYLIWKGVPVEWTFKGCTEYSENFEKLICIVFRLFLIRIWHIWYLFLFIYRNINN